MRDKCPKCRNGNLYTELEKDSGVLTKTCYACGYYWDDSEGYRDNPKLTRRLFKEYFASIVGYRPLSDESLQGRQSDEFYTEPFNFLNCHMCLAAPIRLPDRNRKPVCRQAR